MAVRHPALLLPWARFDLYKTDHGWSRDRATYLSQGSRIVRNGGYPCILETDYQLGNVDMKLAIRTLDDVMGIDPSDHIHPDMSIGLYNMLTFDVVHTNLLMDSGGWVIIAALARHLRLSAKDLIKILRSHPFDAFEVSVWVPVDCEVPWIYEHGALHGVRAKFGH